MGVLGSELQSSDRALRALDLWVIFLVTDYYYYCNNKNPKLDNHSTNEEGLMQTHAGSLIVRTSVSVSPYEQFLIDSVGHVLLLSSTHMAPTILAPCFISG